MMEVDGVDSCMW